MILSDFPDLKIAAVLRQALEMCVWKKKLGAEGRDTGVDFELGVAAVVSALVFLLGTGEIIVE
jgi:hypothetical protein